MTSSLEIIGRTFKWLLHRLICYCLPMPGDKTSLPTRCHFFIFASDVVSNQINKTSDHLWVVFNRTWEDGYTLHILSYRITLFVSYLYPGIWRQYRSAWCRDRVRGWGFYSIGSGLLDHWESFCRGSICSGTGRYSTTEGITESGGNTGVKRLIIQAVLMPWNMKFGVILTADS